MLLHIFLTSLNHIHYGPRILGSCLSPELKKKKKEVSRLQSLSLRWLPSFVFIDTEQNNSDIMPPQGVVWNGPWRRSAIKRGVACNTTALVSRVTFYIWAELLKQWYNIEITFTVPLIWRLCGGLSLSLLGGWKAPGPRCLPNLETFRFWREAGCPQSGT